MHVPSEFYFLFHCNLMSFIDLREYIVSVTVTLNGVLKWILDLWTTYTFMTPDYTLQITIKCRPVFSVYYILH
jgi:hypothetical protein